jgi:hypothetical protein
MQNMPTAPLPCAGIQYNSQFLYDSSYQLFVFWYNVKLNQHLQHQHFMLQPRTYSPTSKMQLMPPTNPLLFNHAVPTSMLARLKHCFLNFMRFWCMFSAAGHICLQ